MVLTIMPIARREGETGRENQKQARDMYPKILQYCCKYTEG